MKKKSTTSKTTDHGRLTTGLVVRSLLSYGQSFNVRVLFGLCVMLAGVFLALFSFGPATTGFAQGTTREEMTLTLAQALGAFQPPACVPGQEMFNDVPTAARSARSSKNWSAAALRAAAAAATTAPRLRSPGNRWRSSW
jgi:hypothetical protein